MFTVGEAVYMWEQGIHENSILSAQFCFENEKSSEKNKIYFKKTKKSKISTPLSHQLQGTLSQKQSAKPVNFQKCPKSDHIYPPPTLLHWPKLQKWVDVRGSSWLSHFHHHFLQFTLHRALEPSQLHHTFGGSRPPMTLVVFTLLPPELIGPLIQAGSPRFCILESLWGFTASSHSLLTTLQREDAINLREMETKVCAKREKER